MRSKVVPISLPESLLDEIDQVAESESRTRSELMREATRSYLTERKEWNALFRYGQEQAKKLGLTTEDVPRLIKEVREELAKEKRAE